MCDHDSFEINCIGCWQSRNKNFCEIYNYFHEVYPKQCFGCWLKNGNHENKDKILTWDFLKKIKENRKKTNIYFWSANLNQN